MIGDEWMVIGEKKPAIRKRGGGFILRGCSLSRRTTYPLRGILFELAYFYNVSPELS